MNPVRLIRPSFFIWIILPAALYLTYRAIGLPHVIFSYDWRDDGQGYSPFAERYYTRCTYVVPYGSCTDGATGGVCGWIQFHNDPKRT